MEIRLIVIGRMRQGCPEAMLIQTYLKRTPWKIDILEIEVKKGKTDKNRTDEENQRLQHAIPANAHVIALDRQGDRIASKDFASCIKTQMESGKKYLIFLVGGADGIDAKTLSHADQSLSFGDMIWPHMLVRVMLVEQIFRAHCILSRHPYHRE